MERPERWKTFAVNILKINLVTGPVVQPHTKLSVWISCDLEDTRSLRRCKNKYISRKRLRQREGGLPVRKLQQKVGILYNDAKPRESEKTD